MGDGFGTYIKISKIPIKDKSITPLKAYPNKLLFILFSIKSLNLIG